MNTHKTPQEIDAEIEKLVALRARVPERTFFNDSNYAAIDAQLRVLRERMSPDAVYNEWSDPSDGVADDEDDGIEDDAFDHHTFDNALEALHWMRGESDEVPSHGWEGLAK